jgi:hypothetical protein
MGNSSNDGSAHGTHDPPPPVHRSLQIYAFDPSLDLDLETARVNRSTISVGWEDDLQPGPVGDYLEVIDVDPASRCVYAPVDLDHRHVLAADGHAPSEGNPQFHQQMVYAVAMKTIGNFERALGRVVHWSPRNWDENGDFLDAEDAYVQRLRIYPHALREANAYYSPDKRALLFGYFNAQNSDAREGLPGGMVFTCLSHDVVAHETTHAILDGIHRRMLEATNPDVLAFHEAFADLVAIFQHFTLPGVLEHQITQTRGDLETENLLAKLAVQFGRATGRGNALRDAIGANDPATGRWRRRERDPSRIGRTFEPHARGAIFVAAVFDAFLTIYRAHTADLLRIASSGTGVLPEGRLHPDLVLRLVAEAETVAQRILNICIRALDYLPPMITIDSDLVPDDKRHYRTAIISAFRDHGIYPRDVRTLSVESLRWKPPSASQQQLLAALLPTVDMLHFMAYAHDYADHAADDRGGRLIEVQAASKRMVEAYRELGRPRESSPAQADSRRRRNEFLRERQFAAYFHNVLYTRARRFAADRRDELRDLLGVDLLSDELKFEVQAVRPTVRVRGDGRTRLELLVLITQRDLRQANSPYGEFHYRFRSGCTLLIDPDVGRVRYAITKRIDAAGRRARQERFLSERLQIEGRDARARYSVWFNGEPKVPQEPFRGLHQHDAGEDWL